MTSFRNFFDERKCEGCRDGVLVHDSDTGDYMNCPSPCPRRNDVEYVADMFNAWLDNVNSDICENDFFKIFAFLIKIKKMDGKDLIEYLHKNGSYSESFYDWLDKNKMIFTADDYFEMGGAI